jgi:exonuclease I
VEYKDEMCKGEWVNGELVWKYSDGLSVTNAHLLNWGFHNRLGHYSHVTVTHTRRWWEAHCKPFLTRKISQLDLEIDRLEKERSEATEYLSKLKADAILTAVEQGVPASEAIAIR